MATRVISTVSILTDYTAAEETTLALTLIGQSAGSALIYNTTLSRARIWNGTIFDSVPDIPVSLIPLVSVALSGLAPATGTASGKFLKDDATWTQAFAGLTKISVQTTAPTSPNSGDLWVNTT